MQHWSGVEPATKHHIILFSHIACRDGRDRSQNQATFCAFVDLRPYAQLYNTDSFGMVFAEALVALGAFAIGGRTGSNRRAGRACCNAHRWQFQYAR